jgi:hypothetical protein
MPFSISMIVLGSQLVLPVADGVPKFDVARSCKLDVAATAGLAVDQSVKSCINDERKARQQLGVALGLRSETTSGHTTRNGSPSAHGCLSAKMGRYPSL